MVDSRNSLMQPIGAAHLNGKPLVHLPCTHVVQEITAQLQDQVDSFRTVAKDYPENMIGSHIYIYWKDDDVWYRAKVIRYLEVTKKFKVVYDDKTEEKLDLV